jgi:hypothetical protein
MRLPSAAAIAPEKVRDYLLVKQDRSDKSAFLQRGGYTRETAERLIAHLYALCAANDASFLDENQFGRYYECVGDLPGAGGRPLRVRTIWMTEHLSGVTKFITLIPIEILQQ